MKHVSIVILLLLAVSFPSLATFSIVAVDTATGEVGGAGASCIANCRIINDLHIGLGAIHTQAYWLQANQNYARALMDSGVAPEDIIDSLVLHDAQNNPTIRQYGIVDLINGSRSAAYTGDSCTAWAGHITGPNYAIQGNILLGQQIVDSMEYAFTHTNGPLTEKLLAALNAAKVPGADTRCLAQNKSAISAFLRVYRVGDNIEYPYCFLNVGNTPTSTDPIDSLNILYDYWLLDMSADADPYLTSVTVARDSLLADGADTTLVRIVPRNNQGHLIGPDLMFDVWTSSEASVSDPQYHPEDSTYTAILTSQSTPMSDTITVYVQSGWRPGEMRDHPIVHYVTLSSPERPMPIANAFSLSAYPNPFNNSTTLQFNLPVTSEIRVFAYDIFGRLSAVIFDGPAGSGSHSITWDADNIASGIYFIVLETSHTRIPQKVLLLK